MLKCYYYFFFCNRGHNLWDGFNCQGLRWVYRNQKTQRDFSLDVIISTMIGCQPCCHGNDFSLDDESSGDAHAQNQSVSLLTSLIPLWERGISRQDWNHVCVRAVAYCCCLSSYLHSNVHNRNLGKGLSLAELDLTLYSLSWFFFFLSPHAHI